MPTNAHYIERMKVHLRKWDADVAALAAEGKQANASLHARYDGHLQDLRATREVAAQTFEEIRFASESAGVKLRVSMDAAWDTMHKSYQVAAAALRK